MPDHVVAGIAVVVVADGVVYRFVTARIKPVKAGNAGRGAELLRQPAGVALVANRRDVRMEAENCACSRKRAACSLLTGAAGVVGVAGLAAVAGVTVPPALVVPPPLADGVTVPVSLPPPQAASSAEAAITAPAPVVPADALRSGLGIYR